MKITSYKWSLSGKTFVFKLSGKPRENYYMFANKMTLEDFGDLTSHSIDFVLSETNRSSWFAVQSYKIIKKNAYVRIGPSMAPTKYKKAKPKPTKKAYSSEKYLDVDDWTDF